MARTSEPLWAVVWPGRPLGEGLPGLMLYDAWMIAARLAAGRPEGASPTVAPIRWQAARHASRQLEDLPEGREVCEEYALLVRHVRRKGEDILFYGSRRAADEAAEAMQLPPGFIQVRRVYWWLAG